MSSLWSRRGSWTKPGSVATGRLVFTFIRPIPSLLPIYRDRVIRGNPLIHHPGFDRRDLFLGEAVEIVYELVDLGLQLGGFGVGIGILGGENLVD